jgi:hypothetical protein
VITKSGDYNPASIHLKNKRIILISNGIHPGEPEGIDACLQLSNDLLSNPKLIPDNVVICIIPIYNVDGALNRSCCSRANQDGPEEYGFRGNAKNLDLNRDFIKCDSKNAKTFTEIFQEWKPDVYVDTHTSDGADYPYTMTLIPTQYDKLNPLLANYMKGNLVPKLYDEMKKSGEEMISYVNTMEEIPDSGIAAFLETPRFSTGYAALFNTIGFVTETHMLKPFDKRVKATYTFLKTLISLVNNDADKIGKLKKEADENTKQQKSFSLAWKLDTAKFDWIDFKGYEAKYKPSEVSGLQRLYYNQDKPYNKKIKYYQHYNTTETVEKPRYYIIPQAWDEVIRRFEWNQIDMKRLSKDTTLEVESYYISDYKTTKQPYESHYLHSGVRIESKKQKIKFFEGDYVIETNQLSDNYIVHTLDPRSVDSFFAWNFFDGVLQQKEWFSDYVFEDIAAKLIKENPELKKKLEEKKQSEKKFAGDASAQLLFIYQNSPYFEKSYSRYPVFRINEEVKLLLNK